MTDLFRTTDTIELEALMSWYGGLTPPLRERVGARIQHVDGAVLSVLAGIASPMFSRVLGLGLTSPVTAGQLDAVVSALEVSGARAALAHLSPYCDEAVGADLEARGLPRVPRSWMRFVRGTEPPRDVHTTMLIRRAEVRDAQAVDDVVRQVYGMPEVASGMVGALIADRHSGWHLFVAQQETAIVAAGALYAKDGVAWLGLGATLPAARGRGAQSALLNAGIHHAVALGCAIICTETGEAVAGDPQHSYHNIERAGFRPLFLRANYLFSRQPAD